jgi:BirA family transcriptional regulator, biotin operon repressor / biotin---[acetyl-CoA-carboxylase] ligase
VLAAVGITMSARGLLDILLEELEWRYAPLERRRRASSGVDEYEGALVTLGQVVASSAAHDDVVGEARAVDEFGQLIVDVDGHEVAISVGDVVHVRPHSVPRRERRRACW